MSLGQFLIGVVVGMGLGSLAYDVIAWWIDSNPRWYL